jgi:hypothetical protein
MIFGDLFREKEMHFIRQVKKKMKFNLERAMKAQRWSSHIALLFPSPWH